ncbi:MAG: hypothetical protein JJ863_17810 [Deltaproteobacteria bacterium]|nr:hypothetical protein [Deltaproteobacteria bacterium]
MTRRAWVLNLDADQELALGASYAPSKRTLAPLRRHAAALASSLPDGDVWVDGDGDPRGLTGVCWCPTPRALRRLAEAGATIPDAPSFDILRQVNGRSFSHALLALEGETRLDDANAARRLLATGRWIVHREHTFAGRGHRFVDGPPSEADLAWVDGGLALGPLVAAPRLALELEVALHGYVKDASVDRGEVTMQRVDGTQWRESVRAPDALGRAETRALHDALDRVALALRDTGYRGPFGVDAFRHAGGFHPLSEINARYSMGWATGMGGWGPY